MSLAVEMLSRRIAKSRRGCVCVGGGFTLKWPARLINCNEKRRCRFEIHVKY